MTAAVRTGGDGSSRRPRRHRRPPRGPGSDSEERPEPVSGLVGQVLRRLGIAEKVDRARAAADWEELVGPHIARVTANPRVRGRTLFVEVQSASWLTELNMRRHELLKQLNRGRERGRIERLIFVQGGGASGTGGTRRREDDTPGG